MYLFFFYLRYNGPGNFYNGFFSDTYKDESNSTMENEYYNFMIGEWTNNIKLKLGKHEFGKSGIPKTLLFAISVSVMVDTLLF